MTSRDQRSGGSPIRLELPPPRTEPLERAGGVLSRLPYRERFLADQLLAADDIFAVARTGTKVDVGSWLLRGRVWVFALARSLAYVACGPCGSRCHAARLPYARLRDSRYNHVTGELALSPATGLPFRGLRLDPIVACQILAQIYRED
jgi:hypothetical protein